MKEKAWRMLKQETYNASQQCLTVKVYAQQN